MSNLDNVLKALKNEQVIAYPTESVFGLGCDPDSLFAIEQLLAIKNRPMEKGLILLAASVDQLEPYIDRSQLSSLQVERMLKSWPGPVTWVVPAHSNTPECITGGRDTVAVRVSDHPTVRLLCQMFSKPVISTSANLSGFPPCLSAEEVKQHLGHTGITVLAGETGGRDKPSAIRDIRTLEIVRQG